MPRPDLTLDPAWQAAVCVPTIRARSGNGMLLRAAASVLAQTHPVRHLSVVEDRFGEGAAGTRQRCLDAVDPELCPWVAFLDDDDWLKPQHLARCLRLACRTGADLIYPWFDCHGPGFSDPLGHFGKPFNPDQPHATTITFVVRTELAQHVRFRGDPTGPVGGEDEWFVRGVVKAGGQVRHLPERTWVWTWHPNDSPNTSGLARNT